MTARGGESGVSSAAAGTSVLYGRVAGEPRTADDADRTSLHLRVTERAVVLVFVGLLVGLVVARVVGEARGVITIAMAAALGALLIDPPVELLSRYMRRWLAILTTLLVVVLGYGLLNAALLGDLNREIAHLKDQAPRAAARIEASGRFSEPAREFRLEQRVREAIDNLKSRTTRGVAQHAAKRFSTYLVGTVLMLFLLSWGPRYARAAFEQIADAARRRRYELVMLATLRTARRYLLLALAQAAAAFMIALATFRVVNLPAPTPLALFVALGTALPYVGIVIASVPALLLAAGFLSLPRALVVVAVVLALELVQINVVQPRVTREVMYGGPALVAVVFLVGYEIYGLGGGLFGYALAVVVLAMTDAIGTEPVYAPSGALADS